MIEKYLNTDTIIANCTGSGVGAISIIRISGDFDLDSFNRFFSIDLIQAVPRSFYYTKIFNDDQLIDLAGLVYFEGPKSFTGENVIEIYCHGNPIIINNIINLFLNLKLCRLAIEGEFSFRAFRNGKIDFVGLEGLDLVLNAKTSFGLKSGFSLMGGRSNKNFFKLRTTFQKLLESIELEIDFSDDVGTDVVKDQQSNIISDLTLILDDLEKKISSKNIDLLKPRVALLGPTNAGKSSLFNYLIGTERAIVSDIDGTTRDFISEQLLINGDFFELVDTAGIRETNDILESRGILKSFDVAEGSFLNILVFDISKFNTDSFDQLGLHTYDLIVFTHTDKVDSFDQTSFINSNGFKNTKNIFFHGVDDSLNIESIFNFITLQWRKIVDSDPIVIKRQIILIEKIIFDFKNFKILYSSCDDIGVLSSELNLLRDSVSELTGVFNVEGILEGIFSSFCIGK